MLHHQYQHKLPSFFLDSIGNGWDIGISWLHESLYDNSDGNIGSRVHISSKSLYSNSEKHQAFGRNK